MELAAPDTSHHLFHVEHRGPYSTLNLSEIVPRGTLTLQSESRIGRETHIGTQPAQGTK